MKLNLPVLGVLFLGGLVTAFPSGDDTGDLEGLAAVQRNNLKQLRYIGRASCNFKTRTSCVNNNCDWVAAHCEGKPGFNGDACLTAPRSNSQGQCLQNQNCQWVPAQCQ